MQGQSSKGNADVMAGPWQCCDSCLLKNEPSIIVLGTKIICLHKFPIGRDVEQCFTHAQWCIQSVCLQYFTHALVSSVKVWAWCKRIDLNCSKIQWDYEINATLKEFLFIWLDLMPVDHLWQCMGSLVCAPLPQSNCGTCYTHIKWKVALCTKAFICKDYSCKYPAFITRVYALWNEKGKRKHLCKINSF